VLDFQAAIAVLEGLVADGAALRPELASMHKKAALGALLERDRPRALEHFVAARDLGLSDEDLASGAALLDQEARLATEMGLAALDKNDLAAAEAQLRKATHYEPGMLAPRNHLGVVLYRRGQFGEAAALWRGVLAEARAEAIELPDPVHLNLALALKAAGDVAAARQVLDEYLALEPQGTWREKTLRAKESLETPR
jgi:Flp pilus assembly protein TadD